ncbi:unnamed protein product [Closterium sp. NIES-53]
MASDGGAAGEDPLCVELPDRLAILPFRNRVLLPGAIVRITCSDPSSVRLVEQELWQKDKPALIGIVPAIEPPGSADSTGSGAAASGSAANSNGAANSGDRNAEGGAGGTGEKAGGGEGAATSNGDANSGEGKAVVRVWGPSGPEEVTGGTAKLLLEDVKWHPRGVAARALHVAKGVERPTGRVTYAVVLQGVCRFAILSINSRGPYHVARVSQLDATPQEADRVRGDDEVRRLGRQLLRVVEELARVMEQEKQRQVTGLRRVALESQQASAGEMQRLADILVASVEGGLAARLAMLDAVNPRMRLQLAAAIISLHLEVSPARVAPRPSSPVSVNSAFLPFPFSLSIAEASSGAASQQHWQQEEKNLHPSPPFCQPSLPFPLSLAEASSGAASQQQWQQEEENPFLLQAPLAAARPPSHFFLLFLSLAWTKRRGRSMKLRLVQQGSSTSSKKKKPPSSSSKPPSLQLGAFPPEETPFVCSHSPFLPFSPYQLQKLRLVQQASSGSKKKKTPLSSSKPPLLQLGPPPHSSSSSASSGGKGGGEGEGRERGAAGDGEEGGEEEEEEDDDDDDDVAVLERRMKEVKMPPNVWRHVRRELKTFEPPQKLAPRGVSAAAARLQHNPAVPGVELLSDLPWGISSPTAAASAGAGAGASGAASAAGAASIGQHSCQILPHFCLSPCRRLRKMQPQQPGYSTTRQYLELLSDLPWGISSPIAGASGAGASIEQHYIVPLGHIVPLFYFIPPHYRRLRKMQPQQPGYSTTRQYLELLSDLPWGISSPITAAAAAGAGGGSSSSALIDVAAAREQLDREHFGLERVKQRILEYIAVRKLKPDATGPVLCFVGPPGVGKTSLVSSIAKALSRKFVRIALGGVKDEADIRGHRRTYVGSMPGRLIEGVKIVLGGVKDEADIRGHRRTYVGSMSGRLIEGVKVKGISCAGLGDVAPSPAAAVLDPEQNKCFQDHAPEWARLPFSPPPPPSPPSTSYLGVPFDLSRVVFVATANRAAPIPAALLDRMELPTRHPSPPLPSLTPSPVSPSPFSHPSVSASPVSISYLGVPFDLSRVVFVATANRAAPIPAALLDRMEVIELLGYTPEEKHRISPSPLHISPISPPSFPHLPSIFPPSPLHLPPISPPSPPHEKLPVSPSAPISPPIQSTSYLGVPFDLSRVVFVATAAYLGVPFDLSRVVFVAMANRAAPIPAATLHVQSLPPPPHQSTSYLGVPFDLSRVVFVATANRAAPIPAALLDRMEVIELPGYTPEEKQRIATRHLIPRVLEQHGITKRHLHISDIVQRIATRHLIPHVLEQHGITKRHLHISDVSLENGCLTSQNWKMVAWSEKPQPNRQPPTLLSLPISPLSSPHHPTVEVLIARYTREEGVRNRTHRPQSRHPLLLSLPIPYLLVSPSLPSTTARSRDDDIALHWRGGSGESEPSLPFFSLTSPPRINPTARSRGADIALHSRGGSEEPEPPAGSTGQACCRAVRSLSQLMAQHRPDTLRCRLVDRDGCGNAMTHNGDGMNHFTRVSLLSLQLPFTPTTPPPHHSPPPSTTPPTTHHHHPPHHPPLTTTIHHTTTPPPTGGPVESMHPRGGGVMRRFFSRLKNNPSSSLISHTTLQPQVAQSNRCIRVAGEVSRADPPLPLGWECPSTQLCYCQPTPHRLTNYTPTHHPQVAQSNRCIRVAREVSGTLLAPGIAPAGAPSSAATSDTTDPLAAAAAVGDAKAELEMEVEAIGMEVSGDRYKAGAPSATADLLAAAAAMGDAKAELEMEVEVIGMESGDTAAVGDAKAELEMEVEAMGMEVSGVRSSAVQCSFECFSAKVVAAVAVEDAKVELEIEVEV